MKNVLIALAAFTLVGCNAVSGPPVTLPGKVQIVDAPRAVPVSCVGKNVGPAPHYTDTKEALKNAGGADGRYNLLTGNWGIRDARLTQLEGVVENCR